MSQLGINDARGNADSVGLNCDWSGFLADPEKLLQWRLDVWHALGSDISQYDALCYSLLDGRYALVPLCEEIHQRMQSLLHKDGIQNHLSHFYPQSYDAIKFLPIQYRDLVNSLSHLLTGDIYTYQLTDLNNESAANVLGSYVAYKRLLEKAIVGLQNTIHGSIEVERDKAVIMADITTLITFLQQDFQTTFDMSISDSSRERIAGFCHSLLDTVDIFSSKESTIPSAYHLDWQVIYKKLYTMFAVVVENKDISQRDALFVIYICSKYEQVCDCMYDLYKLFASIQTMFSREAISLAEYNTYSKAYDTDSSHCIDIFEENDIRNFASILPSWYDTDIDDYLLTLLNCIRKDIYMRIKMLDKFYMSSGYREGTSVLN